jgi:phosphatidate cytidylyltransferase
MAGEDEGRGGSEGRSDDLFEDLDNFFASIDKSEWPDIERPGDEPAAVSEEPAEAESPAELPEAEEAPPGPEGEPQQPEPVPADVAPEPDVQPPVPIESAPTGELSSEDWARLRDVLGEEEEAEEGFEFTDVPTDLSPEETLFGYAGAGGGPDDEDQVLPSWETEETEETEGAEMTESPPPPAEPEGGELTLEDLKKAPSEYGELPRRDEEAPLVPEVPDEAPVGAETLEPEEPSLADVEAAADQLADEFREPPGEVEEDLLTDLGAPEPVRQTVKVGEPESFLGPSWEDPTAQTVTTQAQGPPPDRGRNLPAAVLTGAALVVAAIIIVFFSKPLFVVLAAGVILWGQFELYRTMQGKKYQPAAALGLVLGGFTLAAAYLKGEDAMLFMLLIGLVTSFFWYMAAPPPSRIGLVGNIGATMLGLAYVPLLAGYVFVILSIPGQGRSLMLAVLGLTFLNDIAAFGFGSIWGSRALAPSISPRKSLEGLLGGTFVTILLGIAFVPSIDGMTVVRSVGLALVVCVFAPLGDLAESLLKRDLGVKDMGNILPGHGGVLDRIDSALFVAPAAFYFLRLIF